MFTKEVLQVIVKISITNQSKENKTLMFGCVNEPTAGTNRCNTET